MGWIAQKFGRVYVDQTNTRRGEKTYSAKFDVDVTDLDYVLLVEDLPQIGDAYSAGDTYLICTGREVKEQGNSKQLYEIVYTYDVSPYSDWKVKVTSREIQYVLTQTMATASNDSWLPERLKGGTTYLHTLPLGLSEESVLNMAGDPFDPPVTAVRYATVLDCSIMATSFYNLNWGDPPETDLDGVVYWRGKVNSTKMNLFGLNNDGGGCDLWTLLVEEVDVEKIRKADGTCDIMLNVRIVYDPLSHCQVMLNQGWREKKTAAKKANATDDGQVSSGKPVLLDKDGKKLATTASPDDATWVIVPTFDIADLTMLHLPTTFDGAFIPPPPLV